MMKKNNFLNLLLFLALSLSLSSCSDEYEHVIISTEYGDMEAILYNSTPQHRDNFIKLVEEGYYDSLLFHRVIEGFMIQGGDPDSREAASGKPLGMGGPGYQVPAEIGSPHFRGTLAAARNNNPQKASSGSQFYIVQGSPVTDEILAQIQMAKGVEYNDAQRELYKEIGGTPQLDGDYTVFGEVVDGLEVIDEIAAVTTDQRNRPVKNIRMYIKKK
ncbi:MAG TPA: peptidylprolyl isomerase [Saprospiraceae bacterium]|nr:peptidylprolyl isomerase [Saprospiraceae bacterium]